MPTDPAEARAAAERILVELDISSARPVITGTDARNLIEFEDDITLVATAYLEAADLIRVLRWELHQQHLLEARHWVTEPHNVRQEDCPRCKKLLEPLATDGGGE